LLGFSNNDLILLLMVAATLEPILLIFIFVFLWLLIAKLENLKQVKKLHVPSKSQTITNKNGFSYKCRYIFILESEHKKNHKKVENSTVFHGFWINYVGMFGFKLSLFSLLLQLHEKILLNSKVVKTDLKINFSVY